MIQLINILMEQAGYPYTSTPCQVAIGHPYPQPCLSHLTKSEVIMSQPDALRGQQQARMEWDWDQVSDDTE